jgi:hypothetical protein
VGSSLCRLHGGRFVVRFIHAGAAPVSSARARSVWVITRATHQLWNERVVVIGNGEGAYVREGRAVSNGQLSPCEGR